MVLEMGYHDECFLKTSREILDDWDTIVNPPPPLPPATEVMEIEITDLVEDVPGAVIDNRNDLLDLQIKLMETRLDAAKIAEKPPPAQSKEQFNGSPVVLLNCSWQDLWTDINGDGEYVLSLPINKIVIFCFLGTANLVGTRHRGHIVLRSHVR